MRASQQSIGQALRTGLWLALGGLALCSAPATADEPDRTALRVCSDPNNLPFSSRDGQGFENRIAELFARDLGLPLEYVWQPQRMGFVRNTLRSWLPDQHRYACDLVLEVSPDFEMGVATEPYYHSTYALVYVKDRALDGVRSQEDLLALPQAQRSKLRIGVFAPGPGVDWLLRHGMIDQGISYQMQTGDPDAYPGQVIVRDLAEGKLDAVIIWGPIAGYFASRDQAHRFSLVQMHSEPRIRFEYSISMGMRYREPDWKATVEGLLARNADEIRDILLSYNVPLTEPPTTVRARRDDD